MLTYHESHTHSPTYLVHSRMVRRHWRNSIFATNYLFKRAGHQLKLPVLCHEIHNFSARLSSLFFRFRWKIEEIKREIQRRDGFLRHNKTGPRMSKLGLPWACALVSGLVKKCAQDSWHNIINVILPRISNIFSHLSCHFRVKSQYRRKSIFRNKLPV